MNFKAVKSRGFSILWMSDSHHNDTNHKARIETCLAWGWSRTPTPEAMFHGGDMNETPEESYREYYAGLGYDPEKLYPAPGNHDTEVPWSPAQYGITTGNPHAAMLSRYPKLFRGKLFYYVDIHSLRFIMTTNITDYVTSSNTSAYFGANPPGLNEDNGDYAGYSIEGSAQYQFIDEASRGHRGWLMVGGHRGLWLPFDSDPRRLNKVGRPTLRTAIQNGLSVSWESDVHVGSVTGPWYPNGGENELRVEEGGVGCYSISACGGFATRQPDVSVLPGYTSGDVTDAANNPNVHWAAGGTSASGVCHIHHCVIDGDVAHLTTFGCSNADPEGSVLFTKDLRRNPGSN